MLNKKKFVVAYWGNIPSVIDFKGNVYTCCYCCTNEEYTMGNINDQ
ncbi:SPASM domain-containing protein [Clostridium sp.]